MSSLSQTHELPTPILPVYRVAVLRSESESVHNPARDIVGMLDDRTRWRYRLFTQDTYDALLRSQHEFDCVVVGYNATYRNEPLRTMLNRHPPQIGVLLLHQIAGEFELSTDLRLSLVRLQAPRSDIKEVEHRDPRAELLLNWPERVAPDQLDGVVVCETKPDGASPWRPVLAVGEERPVLIRSPLSRRPATAACTILLEPGRPEHRRLLTNLLVFTAAGPPDTIVLSAPQASAQGTLVRKLRLRGSNALEMPDGAGLDFDQWPLRAVTDVVATGSAAALPNQDQWLKRGGRLTHVDVSTGVLAIRYQASDVQWVARRWSTWLQTAAASTITERVTTTWSYLRALKAIQRLLDGDLERFGLEGPEARREEIRQLLEGRLAGNDNLEDSVAPTAAALEIDASAGHVLGHERRTRIESWLRERTSVHEDGVVKVRPSLAVEDAIEASRVLVDTQLLVSCLPLLDGRITTATLARLRLAAVACRVPLHPANLTPSAQETIIAELHTSLLAACEHLGSLAAYRAFLAEEHAGLLHELDSQSAPLNDEAIATVTKRGTLARNPQAQSSTPEEVCAEALALASFLSIDDVPTTVLTDTDVVPAQLIDSLLVEGLRLRDNYRQRVKETREQARSLGYARATLGSFALVAGAAAGYGTSQVDLAGVLGEGFLPPTAGILVLGCVGKLLDGIGLTPRWLSAIYDTVSGGPEKIANVLKPDSRSQPPELPSGETRTAPTQGTRLGDAPHT